MTSKRKPLAWLTRISAGCLLAGGGVLADERFGVMTHFAHGWELGLMPLVAQSGVTTVRDELYWREVEPEKGVFRFPERFDRMMGTFAQHGLAPLIVLSFENDHYDAGATPHTDEGVAAFARYGGEVLRRYGWQIRAVEVWNEFNGSFVRGPVEQDRPAAYLRLLKATHAEVKRTQPDALVVGGATAGVPLPYWEKLLAGGGLAFMDVLSVHPYRYDDPPEGIETDIAELSALVARYNDGVPKPIWVTEIGWNERPSQAAGDLAIDELVQAQYLARAYVLLLSANVQRVYWYLFRDYNDARMGLLRDGPAATRKATFGAMQTLTEQLRDARFIEREATVGDLYSVRFQRPSGEEVRVLWSLQPRRVAVSGATGAVDLFGRSLDRLDELPLGETPVFVSGPLQGLPAPAAALVADARKGFAANQGENGWSYGFALSGGPFTPLPQHSANDWRRAWWGEQAYLSVTANDQHPSVWQGQPVSAVRRWRSDRHDTVKISGRFRGGKYGGDGVGVSILVNGEVRLRELLGGGNGRAVSRAFDFTETVQPGTTIDFAVDPGPGTNADFDGTAVSATITTKKP